MTNGVLRSFPYGQKSAVTVNVLIDNLSHFSIISKPTHPERKVAWCAAPTDEADDALGTSGGIPFRENETVYLLHSDNVADQMHKHPQAIGLLLLHRDEPFSLDDLSFETSLLKRLLVVRKIEGSPSLSALQSSIQLLFFTLHHWTETLSGIVEQNGSVQDLVDASESVLKNFVDVNDATYSLVAYTKDIEPPDDLSRELVRTGCHKVPAVERAETTGAFKEWRRQHGIEIFPADSVVPFSYVTDIVWINDQYCGHVVMVCNRTPATPGLIDLFQAFSGICKHLIGKALGARSGSPGPCYEAFQKILMDSRCSQDYLENQATIIGVETTGDFCLCLIDHHSSEYAEQPFFLLSLLRETLPHALLFLHEDSIIVLFHMKERDEVSSKSLDQSLSQFCEQYRCMAFVSDHFATLRDMRPAYKQACLTRKYRPCIDIELRPLDDIDRRRTFRFEEAFCFFLYDHKKDSDSELYDFCINHTKLDSIAESSLGRDISDIKLLYYYLFNERKATPTAEQLNMHRNNVIYRVESIERRFGLKLDRYETRQRILSCYRVKILMSSKFRDLLL